MIQVSSLPVSVANLMVITGPLTCSVPMSKKTGQNVLFTNMSKLPEKSIFLTRAIVRIKSLPSLRFFFCLPYDDSEYDRGGLLSV